MTQEEKQLLLKDLCARLLYEVILLSPNNKITYQTDGNTAAELLIEEGWKPYLHPMSSMTEEEVKEYKAFHCVAYEHTHFYPQFCTVKNELNMFDWLNKNHFDYRGLISMGLALEAPNEIYNN